MSMFPCDESFSKGISDIICRLQNTEYAEKARTAFEEARTYNDNSQIVQVFRNLNHEIQTSEVEFVQRASKDLQALLEQESARAADVSRKILSRKEEDISPEPMDVNTDQTVVVEEQTITRKRKKETTEGLEEPPAKRQKIEIQTALSVETFPAEEVGVLPLDIIQKIAGNLSAAQKNLIFNTLWESKSSHAARFREAIIRNDLQDVPAVDLEFAQLYRSTFGKSLVLTQETVQNWEAQLKADKDIKTATVEYRFYTTLQRLKELPKEFDALPEDVRRYFAKSDGSQIQGPEILKDQQLCKQVLKAIRAHNLVCLGNPPLLLNRNKSSLDWLLKAGKDINEKLKTEARNFTWLWLPCEITHIPVEIEYFTTLTSLCCANCKSLTAVPPEIGNLTELKWVDFSNCISLTSFPTAMEKLKKIETLDIRGCRKLLLSRELAERFKGISDFRCPRGSLPPDVQPPYPPSWMIVDDDVGEQPSLRYSIT